MRLPSHPLHALAWAAAVSAGGPWRLALKVDNLADKAHVATCLGRGDCWFGTRRKAIATVAYRW